MLVSLRKLTHWGLLTNILYDLISRINHGNCLILLLDRVWSRCISCASCSWSFRCVSDLTSCKRLWYLLSLLWVLDFNVCCWQSLFTCVVVRFANLLHSVIMWHVKSFVRVDSTLRVWVPLSATYGIVLIIKYCRAIRIVCLRNETRLPWVVPAMFQIDFWQFWLIALITRSRTMTWALCRVRWNCRHVRRAHIVDGVESIRTFTCIKWSVHPLLRCFWSDCSVLQRRSIGSLRNSWVIQIEIIYPWLLLHVYD